MVGASISSAASADSGIVRISVVKGGWRMGHADLSRTAIPVVGRRRRRWPRLRSVADDLGWPAIIAELAALALMAEWAAFLSAR